MKRSLIIVYITVFLDLLGFGIVIPALPFYAMTIGASGFWLGALMTAYSGAQLLGAPLWGRFSDRVGRRPVLLLCLASSSASLFLTGLAPSLALLLAARMLAGFFGGSIGVAQAIIADLTDQKERARFMGFLGASIGLGFVLGPALGTLFGGQFWRAAFVAASLALVNFSLGLKFLQESLPPALRRDSRSRVTLRNLGTAVSRPAVARIMAAIFLTTAGFVAMETTFAPMAKQDLKLDFRGFGFMLSYVGVIMVLVQGLLLGRLARRFGEARLAAAGCLMAACALGFLSLAAQNGTLSQTIYMMGLLGLGYGLAGPSLSTLLSAFSDPRSQGGMLGLGQAAAALSRAAMPLMAGWAFDVSPHMPYIAGAGLMAVAGLLVFNIKQS